MAFLVKGIVDDIQGELVSRLYSDGTVDELTVSMRVTGAMKGLGTYGTDEVFGSNSCFLSLLLEPRSCFHRSSDCYLLTILNFLKVVHAVMCALFFCHSPSLSQVEDPETSEHREQLRSARKAFVDALAILNEVRLS